MKQLKANIVQKNYIFCENTNYYIFDIWRYKSTKVHPGEKQPRF